MPSSLPRRNCKVHLSLTSSATLAFPTYPLGRLPRQLFRGLVERSLALRPESSRDHQVILSIEGSDEFVASFAASIATGQATIPRQDFHLLKYTRIHGARISPIVDARSTVTDLCALPPRSSTTLQRSVDLLDGPHGGRMLAGFEPRKRLMPHAGQLGQLVLGQNNFDRLILSGSAASSAMLKID